MYETNPYFYGTGRRKEGDDCGPFRKYLSRSGDGLFPGQRGSPTDHGGFAQERRQPAVDCRGSGNQQGYLVAPDEKAWDPVAGRRTVMARFCP